MLTDGRQGVLHRSIGYLLMSAFCATIVGCADPLPPEHKAAISRIQGLGGRVLFAEGGYSINLQNSRIVDEDLKELHKIQDLKALDLQNTRITDEGLKEIANLKSVATVNLNGTATTRAGRETLRKARPDMLVRQ